MQTTNKEIPPVASTPSRSGLALTAFSVFVVCLLSYGLNFFLAASPAVLRPDIGSDLLVSDALKAGESALGLIGPDGFAAYHSQYGAQLGFFRLIGAPDHVTIEALPFVNACLLAVIVGLLTWLVGIRLFANRGALAFGLTLALSPMIIALADSLYWMAWAWFLPMLVSLAIGPRLFGWPGLLTGFLLWFATLTWANLLGYEYASTIALAAATPIVCMGLRCGHGMIRTATPCLVLGVTSVLAMLAAFMLHANNSPSTDGSLIGWEQIKLIANKRVGGHSSTEELRGACSMTPGVAILRGEKHDIQVETCVRNLKRAQSVPLPVVLVTYFSFRRTVPYLSGPDIIDDPHLAPARKALRSLDISGFVQTLKLHHLPAVLAALIKLPLTALIVWMAIGITVARFWRCRLLNGPYALMLGVALLAPLSWFVLAKAHSYGHMHLNFVLWNLPFLPLLMGVLMDRKTTVR